MPTYPDSNTDLVTIHELNLRIGTRILIEAFTLCLKRGFRTGITGPSGCGKTTLLRSIVGRQPVDTSDASKFYVTTGPIGYVPQEGGLLPWYSVARNLSVFATSVVPDAEAWCQSVLFDTDLALLADAFPSKLSGGETQRARLACALASQPIFCCADEPLTEVGLLQKWEILRRWSSRMHALNTALLLVSHDVDTLMYLCDEIIILDGSPNHPATTVNKFIIDEQTHPRNPKSLNSGLFENKRREILKHLYLGAE